MALAALVLVALVSSAAGQDLSPEERRTIDIFRRAKPSVVHITSVALRRDFFTLDIQQIPAGTGSGSGTARATSSPTST